MARGATALPAYRKGDAFEPKSADAEDHVTALAELEYDDSGLGADAEGARLLSSSSSSSPSTSEQRNSKRSPSSRRHRGPRGASDSDNADKPRALSRRSAVWAGAFVAASAFVFLVVPAFLPNNAHLYDSGSSRPTDWKDGIASNGTHDFRKTVLMLSIDGLRADYLDRGLSPHLLEISRKGLRAKYMKPIFPTLTFPNHWSILTGLYAESHGIVANDFFDPGTNSSFHYHDDKIARMAHWWGGEPIWETARRAGLITANLMWLGPEVTRAGVKNNYYVGWEDKTHMQDKHDQIMNWIDLPFDKRPQLILAYEHHLDKAGHSKGPGSKLVNTVLQEVDALAKSIHTSLRERNLAHIVDVIFVSDHGMTDTSNNRVVYLDDVMGEDHAAQIVHEEGWPSVGLRLKEEANVTDVLNRLLTSKPATSNPPAIDVYTADTMPARFHFSPKNNERIAPIYVVPRIGWAISNHHEHEVVMQGHYHPRGNHGYDNNESAMHAMFVADGPFTTQLKKRQIQRRSTSLSTRLPRPLRRLLRRTSLLSGEQALEKRREPEVIEGFNNVEVYSLIVKLLGMEQFAAPHNGTAGFWDKYLDEDDD